MDAMLSFTFYFLRHGALVAATGALVSCGNIQNLALKKQQKRTQRDLDKVKQSASEEATKRLGKNAGGQVAYANPDGGFVLVAPLKGMSLPTGLEMESRSGREGPVSGKVRISLERKGGFVAADILSGSPAVDDIVIPIGLKKEVVYKPIATPATDAALSTGPASAGSTGPINTVNLDGNQSTPESMMRPELVPSITSP